MALPFDSTTIRELPYTIEAWVWPMITAIVVSGVLVLVCVIGLFWMAARPARQAVVILMPATSSTVSTTDDSRSPLNALHPATKDKDNVAAN
ncbi:MAG TPA: hypothetical protein VHU84_04830 [Lacipirellulaceae bacterium]|jgi:hypothetical protein|nr:hypothetical protein [Lacipirellulaceae bacterium]